MDDEKDEGLPFNIGFYRHYKGQWYYVIGLARHSETGEMMVVYMPLYTRADNVKDNVNFTVRPLSMFIETITLDGGALGPPLKVPRFKYMGGSDNG